MGKILACLIFFSWLTLCLPCGLGVPNSKYFRFKWTSLNTVLSVLLLLVCDYIFLNIHLNKLVAPGSAASSKLSSQIIFIEVYWGKMVADNVIRVGSILYCHKIIELIKSILNLQSSLQVNFYHTTGVGVGVGGGHQGKTILGIGGLGGLLIEQEKNSDSDTKTVMAAVRDGISQKLGIQKSNLDFGCLLSSCSDYIKWFLFCTLTISAIATIGDVILYIDQDFPTNGAKNSEKLCLFLMPKSESLLNLVLFLSDSVQVVSVQFSLIFTVVIGVLLIELHDHFFRNLKIWTRSCCEQNNVFKSWKSVGQDAMMKNELINNFVELKGCFDTFSSVAGLYSLCIIFEATCSIIGGFGAMTLQSKESNFIDAFTDFLTILCVTRLGNFVQSKIDYNRTDFEDEIAELYQFDIQNDEVNQAIELAVNWRWKLTACEVFDINHDLIPAIIATVMTVFIFMFQLKGSEVEAVEI